jgi:hypothetical protein
LWYMFGSVIFAFSGERKEFRIAGFALHLQRVNIFTIFRWEYICRIFV